MPAVRCRVPVTVRLVGRPDEATWSRVEDVLAERYTAVLREMEGRARLPGPPPRPAGPVRELFDPGRVRTEGYEIAGYEDGEPIVVPTEGPGATSLTPTIVGYTEGELRKAIRKAFPGTGGDPREGVHHGIYARTRDSDRPMLYFIRLGPSGRQEVHWLFLYGWVDDQKAPLKLGPGFYTVIFPPGGRGRLLRNGQPVYDDMENPDDIDLTIAFVVDPQQVSEPEAPPAWKFVPVMYIKASNLTSPLATGAESVYWAVTEIWRVDEHWRPKQRTPFLFVYPHYRWEIRKLPDDDAADQSPTLVRTGDQWAIRHTWKEPGRYQVKCIVTVDAEGISPDPVIDRRGEEIFERGFMMAFQLATWEAQERDTGTGVWKDRSAAELLQRYRDELLAEEQREPPNQATIDNLKVTIGKLSDQLYPTYPTAVGPFPIHAMFTELKTSKMWPICLFLAFGMTGDTEKPYRWYLIDVTYPAFYKTYEGEGATPHSALLAAFEDSRTRFLRTYPPGHILARVSRTYLAEHGIEVATEFFEGQDFRDFTIETYSLYKDAWEWVTLGVGVVGMAGLAASFVFPPSAAIAAVLVVTGGFGVALSVLSLHERVQTNSFYWDVETFSDLANIAASIAQLGALAAGARAAKLARLLEKAEDLPADLIASFKSAKMLAEKVQKALLVTQLGTDLANGLIIADSTREQLSLVDVEFDEEKLEDFQETYGPKEGLRRWQQARQNRITGILAQAAFDATLVVVSLRSGATEYGKLPGRDVPPPRPTPEPLPDPGVGRVTVDEPSQRWKSREELQAAAAADPQAKRDLDWYDKASMKQLHARAAEGDAIATQEVNRLFGGRPHQPGPSPEALEAAWQAEKGPSGRWTSREELQAAAAADPQAKRDLDWYDNEASEELLRARGEQGDAIATEELNRRWSGRPHQEVPSPKAVEPLWRAHEEPSGGWTSLEELEAAAGADPQAKRDLDWYHLAPTELLRAREQGDAIATQELNRREGGKRRPYRLQPYVDPEIRQLLKREVEQHRDHIEHHRPELEAERGVRPEPPEPFPWTKRTRFGELRVPTAKQLRGYMGTIGAAMSDIPAFLGETFHGASPWAFGSFDPVHPVRTRKTTRTEDHGHAELDIGQQIHDRLAALTPEELAAAKGKTVWIHVDQAVCGSCRTGLSNRALTGVLRSLTENNKDIRFVFTADDTNEVIVLHNGMRQF